MSNILDDLRSLRLPPSPPSPQERLHKALLQAQEPLLWEGQSKSSIQQAGLALGLVALLIGIVLSVALQLEAGAFDDLWSALEHFMFPMLLGIVFITLVLIERYRHLSYFGISPTKIWVVRAKTIEQYHLVNIHKFELISSTGGYGTIVGLHTSENAFTHTIDQQTVVELAHVPDAYNLYQQIQQWHQKALEPTKDDVVDA